MAKKRAGNIFVVVSFFLFNTRPNPISGSAERDDVLFFYSLKKKKEMAVSGAWLVVIFSFISCSHVVC